MFVRMIRKEVENMESIQFKDHTFLLNTKDLSYMFRIDRYQHLEHLHFGARCRIEDSDAFSFKKYISHGDTIAYAKEDPYYSIDSLPQEFPTYGTGDFNEVPIEIEHQASHTLDLIFDSYEIIHGNLKMESLPSSYGCDQTLLIHMKDKVKPIYVDLIYAIYPEENIISRRAVLKNLSEEDLVIRKFLSYSIDLCEDDLVLMDFHGAWDKEMHLQEHEIKEGTLLVSSRVGFASSKNNPGFLIRQADTDEFHGKAWGFNLVYSGNHYSSISKNEYGFHRIQGGISPDRFHKILKTNESFETPEAILSYSDQGLNDLSHHFHDFVNEHIITSNWKKKERPILVNSWEGFGFDFHKEDLIEKLARNAKDLGIEMFVLDDGWFGRRDSDKRGLGDYDCNLNKIPGGIASLSEEVHKLGLLFGIWVEPEAISIDSALYEAHPEFALKEEGREFFFGRNELLMDLTKKEVRDYIVENVSKLIDENKVDYIKWDMNRMMNGVSGAYNHDYILGLYEVLDRIFTPRPDVLFESCSSGGNRFDLGILCYSPQIWSSDDTDPIERIDIQKGLSYLYPLSTMGAHVSACPHSQTLRKTPLETRFAVSAYGCLGYELDLSRLSDVEKFEVRKQTAWYKKYRSLFQFGRFNRLKAEKGQESFEVSDGKRTVVSKFRRLLHAAPYFDKLTATGLKKDQLYSVCSRQYFHELSNSNYAGSVNEDIDTETKEFLKKHPNLVLSEQYYTASGAALKEGICLDPLYLGTGYNKKIRIPLDYGSDMFLIEEK